MEFPGYDEDALLASVNLIKRSGACGFEVGYLDDGVPVEKARWWAKASYRGAAVTVEDRTGPVEAAEALARRIIAGAKCRRCGEPITLNDDDSGCRWRRVGVEWQPGCGLPIDTSIPVGDEPVLHHLDSETRRAAGA